MPEIEEPVGTDETAETQTTEDEASDDVEAHSSGSLLDLQGQSSSLSSPACASVLSVGNAA